MVFVFLIPFVYVYHASKDLRAEIISPSINMVQNGVDLNNVTRVYKDSHT